MRNTYLDYCIEHNYTAQDYMAFESIIKRRFRYKVYVVRCRVVDSIKGLFNVLD